MSHWLPSPHRNWRLDALLVGVKIKGGASLEFWMRGRGRWEAGQQHGLTLTSFSSTDSPPATLGFFTVMVLLSSWMWLVRKAFFLKWFCYQYILTIEYIVSFVNPNPPESKPPEPMPSWDLVNLQREVNLIHFSPQIGSSQWIWPILGHPRWASNITLHNIRHACTNHQMV